VEAGSGLLRTEPKIFEALRALSLLQTRKKLAKVTYVYASAMESPKVYTPRSTVIIDVHSAWLGARRVQPDVVDYTLVQKWINHCREHHGSTCNFAALQDI